MQYGQISKVWYLSHRLSLVWRIVGVIFLWLERDWTANSPLCSSAHQFHSPPPSLRIITLLLFHSIQSSPRHSKIMNFKHCDNKEWHDISYNIVIVHYRSRSDLYYVKSHYAKFRLTPYPLFFCFFLWECPSCVQTHPKTPRPEQGGQAKHDCSSTPHLP